MATLNIHLTDHLSQMVKDKVASGLYDNESEVICESLRLLDAQEYQTVALPPSKQKVLEILRKQETYLKTQGLSSLYLFGSVLSNTADYDSDIDLFFELQQHDNHFSLLDLVKTKVFLEEKLGSKVDLVMKEGLDPVIKEDVIAEALRIF